MTSSKQLSKREHWLIWKLIESLRTRNIPFEGPDGEFAADFNSIRDKCIDKGFDYDPQKER